MSENKKTEIVTLRKQKLSIREISKKVGYSKSSVAEFLKKYDLTRSVERKTGSGPRRKTSSAEDRLLKRMSLQDRFKTAEHIRKEFVEASGTVVSTRTVRRRLRAAGLCGRSPAKKPLLTKKMREKRLKWARDHENWTEGDWKKVIFSDESKFNIFGSDGMQYVRRRTGERYSDECIRRTVKHGGSRMVWGCFSFHGIGQLALIGGTVNGIKYKTILKEHLVPSLEQHYSEETDLIFQDDSAPCHRARLVSNDAICFLIMSVIYCGDLIKVVFLLVF